MTGGELAYGCPKPPALMPSPSFACACSRIGTSADINQSMPYDFRDLCEHSTGHRKTKSTTSPPTLFLRVHVRTCAPSETILESAGIREDVLDQNLSLYFGSEATFEKRSTKDGQRAYLINGVRVKATPAILDDLRIMSRKADENDKKASYKTPSNQKSSQQYGRSSERAPYPPRRHDSYNAKSDIRKFSSDPLPAFSPHNTSDLASPHGKETGIDISRTPSHYDFNASEVNETRRDFRLFPEQEEDDSSQQSAQIMRPPRQDSIPQTAQVPRSSYAPGNVDPQRGSSAVPIRQTHRGGQDLYQQKPESAYRSASQQRADIEARHQPEQFPKRQPALVSQSPPVSYQDQDRSQQPYAGPYPASTTYHPGQAKKESDFDDFRQWQEYVRLRDRYERGRPTEPQRTLSSKYDEQRETPPPLYSETDSRQHKPRQPSPDTHGQNRDRQHSSDTYVQQGAGERRYYRNK